MVEVTNLQQLGRAVEVIFGRTYPAFGKLPENMFEAAQDEIQKAFIICCLRHTNGNCVKASKSLGVNRNTLRKMVQKYGIRVEAFRENSHDPVRRWPEPTSH